MSDFDTFIDDLKILWEAHKYWVGISSLILSISSNGLASFLFWVIGVVSLISTWSDSRNNKKLLVKEDSDV